MARIEEANARDNMDETFIFAMATPINLLQCIPLFPLKRGKARDPLYMPIQVAATRHQK